jgi:hypothetical protein
MSWLGPPPEPDRQPTDPDQVDDEPVEDEITTLLRDPVVRWRAKILIDHGMTIRQARALALDRRVDTRWVIDSLLVKGCDPNVAFDIASF